MASNAFNSGNFDQGRRRAIEDAIQRLPPEYRAALRLKMFQGLSYREIATELAISAKSVERYLAHGLLYVHRFAKQHDGRAQR